GGRDRDARLDPRLARLADGSAVVAVQALEQIAFQPPGNGAAARLDMEARVALVLEARVEPGEGRDHALVAAPLHVRAVERGVANRSAEAVPPSHAVQTLRPADDAREGRAPPPDERHAACD